MGEVGYGWRGGGGVQTPPGIRVDGLDIKRVSLPDGGRRGDRVKYLRAVGRQERGQSREWRRPADFDGSDDGVHGRSPSTSTK